MSPARALISINLVGVLELVFTSAEDPKSAATPSEIDLSPFEIYLAEINPQPSSN
jgi:hypothetical protein